MNQHQKNVSNHQGNRISTESTSIQPRQPNGLPKRADESEANEPRREAAMEAKMTPPNLKAYEQKEAGMSGADMPATKVKSGPAY